MSLRCVTATIFIAICSLYHCAARAIGDRVPYYVSSKEGSSGKLRTPQGLEITTSPPSDPSSLLLTFWAFDKVVDDCIPIAVYTTDFGYQALTTEGDENIDFWFYAYPRDDFNHLQHVDLVRYDVLARRRNFRRRYRFHNDYDEFVIAVHEFNDTVTPEPSWGEFYFWAFDHDDKYLSDVRIENCKNCSLKPAFSPDVYTYFVMAPDNVFGLYLNTTPSEGVHFVIDDPRYSLSEEEKRQHQVTEMVMFKVGTFENVMKMNREEVNKTLSIFYDPQWITKMDIDEWEGQSLYGWVLEFASRQDSVNKIMNKWKEMKGDITSVPVGAMAQEFGFGNVSNQTEAEIEEDPMAKWDRMDAWGLLSDAYSPITVDIHYDLHHYRVFVARRAGEVDRKQFKLIMEVQKETLYKIAMKNCTAITDEAHLLMMIPEWWNKNRTWVVTLSIMLVMSMWIGWNRKKHNKMVRDHLARRRAEMDRMMQKGG